MKLLTFSVKCSLPRYRLSFFTFLSRDRIMAWSGLKIDFILGGREVCTKCGDRPDNTSPLSQNEKVRSFFSYFGGKSLSSFSPVFSLPSVNMTLSALLMGKE